MRGSSPRKTIKIASCTSYLPGQPGAKAGTEVPQGLERPNGLHFREAKIVCSDGALTWGRALRRRRNLGERQRASLSCCGEGGGPASEGGFAEGGQAVMAGLGALEPAIDIAQQDLAGVGGCGAQIARAAGAGAQPCGAGEGALAIGGHDRLAGRAAGRGIAVAARM